MANTVNINTQAMNTINQLLHQRIDKAGMFVQNKARENCPVISSELRRSILSQSEGYKTTIGTNKEYAIAVHEGHGSYQGKPFLRDAVFNNLAEIKNILKEG